MGCTSSEVHARARPCMPHVVEEVGQMTRPLSTDPVRVLVVDDQASFRAVVRQVLTAGGFVVVGEAIDGFGAVRACEELLPDLVLLDVQLPDVDGFTVAAALRASVEPPVVVLVSTRSSGDYGSTITRCGARGFITKSELTAQAIHRLLLDA